MAKIDELLTTRTGIPMTMTMTTITNSIMNAYAISATTTTRHLNTVVIDASAVTTAADETFDDYIPTSTDPGSSLFLIALLICITSIMALPLYITCIQRCTKKKKNASCLHDTTTSTVCKNLQVDDDDDHEYDLGDLEIPCGCIVTSNEFMNDKLQITVYTRQTNQIIKYEETKKKSKILSSLLKKYTLCGTTSSCLHYLWTLIKLDKEMKRILQLAIPFTCSAIIKNASELILLAIISHSLGTDDMVAYAMVGLIISVSSSFLGGWIEAISSLGSMAYGAKKYELLGQYLKISCIAYTLCEVPMAIIWYCSIGKILLLLGFDESVASIGQDYVWVAMSIQIMTSLNMGLMEFLAVIEKEHYANIMYCTSCFLGVGMVAVATRLSDVSLVELGLVLLLNKALLFFLNIIISDKMGWLKEFESGIFGRLSFKSLSVVEAVFKVAVPLAFGNLLGNAEWEILTILAAMLGPAEAATWAILGYVWEFFESTTEAIGDASELRVAHHLGNGQPDMAKLSAYKSMLLAAIVTGLSSVLLMSLVDQLPPLMTYDTTIQGMLVQLFPLVALGNVTMSMGMVCWAIVGAQGRYRLSTTIATSCAFFITIPVGTALTIRKVNLQGLTFAVVVGYTITAMILSLVVLTSDWKALSDEIQEEVDDLDNASSYNKGCLTEVVLSDTPPITPPATPYTPPISPDSRPDDCERNVELFGCQMIQLAKGELLLPPNEDFMLSPLTPDQCSENFIDKPWDEELLDTPSSLCCSHMLLLENSAEISMLKVEDKMTESKYPQLTTGAPSTILSPHPMNDIAPLQFNTQARRESRYAMLQELAIGRKDGSAIERQETHNFSVNGGSILSSDCNNDFDDDDIASIESILSDLD
jgi:MATE family multidrug resistance protein